MLSDPAATQSVSAIAEDLCVADASSFGRVFKREFGHSPGDVRSAARAGLALPVRPRGLVGGRRLWRAPSRVLAAQGRWPTIVEPQARAASG